MKNRIFDSIIFNLENDSFEILDGTLGTYKISDIKKCSVLNEEAKFRGKTEPFLHQVLGGVSFFAFGENLMYVGLKLVTKDNNKLAVYISKKPVSFNTDTFLRDKKEAETIKKIFDKVINKS
ncbi:hypothetical protein [Floccifex sp.]|uniref:hypothetical protein n=1 Tax=Floccifex sp. TaxID=2815810 RepID=UPI003F078DA2